MNVTVVTLLLAPTFAAAQSHEQRLETGLFLTYAHLEFDVGDTIVTYDARAVFVSQREPRRPVAGFTTRNRQWSLGVGKRF
jgi:hypothetical protein